jgi:flagellar biosynthesis/type III secretory pathway chaperone
VLVELEQLLEGERAALVCLDREAIDGYAARKLELDAALQEAVKLTPLAASDKQLLERVRQAALENQLLLAHARSCVQGVLSLVTPGSAPVYSAPGYAPPGHGPSAHTSPSPPPIALNLRR